ncbi:hypothetical protein [Ferrimicrobium acidiphilum]|uniref:hypothetical protein n=1 Tax=Ferrimicrobium acidiphilum TaxID=121039 RepID=UPI0023F14786|nr:hypothetical protein [Ferrimicrobium acidiphilum]
MQERNMAKRQVHDTQEALPSLPVQVDENEVLLPEEVFMAWLTAFRNHYSDTLKWLADH